jgi:hypothetical protein
MVKSARRVLERTPAFQGAFREGFSSSRAVDSKGLLELRYGSEVYVQSDVALEDVVLQSEQ